MSGDLVICRRFIPPRGVVRRLAGTGVIASFPLGRGLAPAGPASTTPTATTASAAAFTRGTVVAGGRIIDPLAEALASRRRFEAGVIGAAAVAGVMVAGVMVAALPVVSPPLVHGAIARAPRLPVIVAAFTPPFGDRFRSRKTSRCVATGRAR